MNDKLQGVEYMVFRETIVRGMKPFHGYGVEITLGYYGGSVDFSVPPIYATQGEALKVAKDVVAIVAPEQPEQNIIVTDFDGLQERTDFQPDSD